MSAARAAPARAGCIAAAGAMTTPHSVARAGACRRPLPLPRALTGSRVVAAMLALLDDAPVPKAPPRTRTDASCVPDATACAWVEPLRAS